MNLYFFFSGCVEERNSGLRFCQEFWIPRKPVTDTLLTIKKHDIDIPLARITVRRFLFFSFSFDFVLKGMLAALTDENS